MRLLSALGFAVLALLSTPAIAAGPPSPQVVATHGYVYVNFPKGHAAPLSVAPLSGGRPIPLDARADADRNAQGAWLPAGQYRLVEWKGRRWDTPPFEVQAGRITDLGGLVGIGIGGDQVAFLPTHHAENRGDVAIAVEEFASVLTSPDPIAWAPSTRLPPITIGPPGSGMGLLVSMIVADAHRKATPSLLGQLATAPTNDAFLALARKVTPPLTEEPAIAPDGTLYFGADLGQVRVRAPDGSWSNLGFDTMRVVTSIEYADGSLVAGTDDGAIRRSTDGGATWQPLKALSPTEIVQDIDHDATQWLVQTMRWEHHPHPGKRPITVLVYRATNADLTDLAPIREFKVTYKDRFKWIGAKPLLLDGRYTLSAPQLFRLDTNTMTWKALSPPSDVNMHHIDGTTGTLTAVKAQGVFSKVWLSTDFGDTWRQLDRPPYHISYLQMDTPDSGWALRLNFENASNTTAWNIYTFDKTIGDWKLADKPPHMCKPIRVSKDMPVLCFRNDASIWRRDAEKWVVEFETMAR